MKEMELKDITCTRYKKQCIEFIKVNGWKIEDTYEDSEYSTFNKKDNVSISFSTDQGEIVFLNDNGDFKTFIINKDILYTLLGFMIDKRFISIDYKIK